MKQTAVEWLEEELKANLTKIILEYDYELIEDLFTKAKAMEKEQIEKAFNKGLITENVYYGYDDNKSKQYYNETFKSE